MSIRAVRPSARTTIPSPPCAHGSPRGSSPVRSAISWPVRRTGRRCSRVCRWRARGACSGALEAPAEPPPRLRSARDFGKAAIGVASRHGCAHAPPALTSGAMSGTRQMRVVVAGGGVAGLEAVLALQSLAGELLEIELLAPARHFTYRPLAVAAPFDA